MYLTISGVWSSYVDDTPPKFTSSRMKNESWKTFLNIFVPRAAHTLVDNFFLYLEPIPLFCLYEKGFWGVSLRCFYCFISSLGFSK